jgi:hypothetical protein
VDLLRLLSVQSERLAKEVEVSLPEESLAALEGRGCLRLPVWQKGLGQEVLELPLECLGACLGGFKALPELLVLLFELCKLLFELGELLALEGVAQLRVFEQLLEVF